MKCSTYERYYYYYLTQNIICADLTWKALIFSVLKKEEELGSSTLIYISQYASTAVWSQGNLLASPGALLFSEPQFPHLSEPPSSTVNVINNYVVPHWLVTERGQTQNSKNQCGKEEPGVGKSQGNSTKGNTDGCTQHSLLSVGLSLNQLTDQWMPTADQATRGKQRPHVQRVHQLLCW